MTRDDGRRPARRGIMRSAGVLLPGPLAGALLAGALLVGALLAGALLASPALAQQQGCPGVFAGGRAPALLNARLAQRTHGLCFGAFATLESGVTRGALWSAEHLSPESVGAARGMVREDAFHAEEAVPFEDRADPEDYVRSGFDRGHMAPSGDMPDAASQHASFSMANMVPQAPRLNRGAWERIESAVRDLAQDGGADGVYVVTGPMFRGRALQSLPAGELVPSAVFKAVLEPGVGAAAYACTNRDAARCRVIPIAHLTRLTGIDPFPSLSAGARITAIALPHPAPSRARRRREQEGGVP